MVIDTVIDIGGSKKVTLSPTKPRIVALNLQGEAMRQHEQLMKCRRKVNELNSNLSAAMASLESANIDIDRLNAEISELKEALKVERERNAKLSKQAKKQQKTSEPQDGTNIPDGV